MKLKSLALTALLMISSSTLFADVSLPYGEGSGKVDYINYKRFPGIEEPLPYGPLSFRLVGDNIWVADTVGGKLMQLTKGGSLVSEFSICPSGTKAYEIDQYGMPNSKVFIEDMAPIYGEYGDLKAWWILESQNNKALKYSVDGQKLAEIDGSDFAQPTRIEIGRSGNIFIADMGKKAIFTYDAQGNFLNKQNWEWSGMAIAGYDDKLYRLMYMGEEHKNMLVCTNLSGKVVKTKLLDIENMVNPKLWWVDEDSSECVITYTPATGHKGSYNIVRVGLDGKVKASGQLTSPFAMNRFIDNLDGEVYVGKCDFSVAPDGKFEVVPYSLP